MTAEPAPPRSTDHVECAGCEVSPSWAVGQICTECGARSGWDAGAACPACLAPLAVDYRPPEAPAASLRTRWEGRPATLFRYAELLPPLPRSLQDRLEFPASPLRRAVRLGEHLGLDQPGLRAV